jgi:hypothetical protein
VDVAKISKMHLTHVLNFSICHIHVAYYAGFHVLQVSMAHGKQCLPSAQISHALNIKNVCFWQESMHCAVRGMPHNVTQHDYE